MRAYSLLLLTAWGVAAAAQTTIDRVVVIVNKQVITQTDWDVQERFEALVNGRGPESVEFSAASLERLVDQQLMREQIESARMDPMTPEQIAAQVATMRKQIAPNDDDQQWRAKLARYQLTEDEFAHRLAAQVEVLQFVDMRFRPSVHIESEEIESYYEKHLLPELLKSSAPRESIPGLKEVEPKIRGILAEEKLNEMLQLWLVNLRSQSRVKRLTAEAKAADSGAH